MINAYGKPEEKGRDHLRDLRADGRICSGLKLISKKRSENVDFFHLV
jgi:hypothetical protein